MLYALKGKFQVLAKRFATSGLTANHASILGWVFVLLSTACLYYGLEKIFSLESNWALLLFSIFTFLRLIFNALDGMIARANNKATAMGELANELSDICGDTICYGVLFWVPGVNIFTLAIFLISCWFAEFVGIMGRALPGHVRRHESLFGGKSERSLLFCVFTLTCFFNPSFFSNINVFLSILCILTLGTGIVRILKIKKQTAGRDYVSHTSYGS